MRFRSMGVRGWATMALAALVAAPAAAADGGRAEPVPFRVGFSRALFADLNPNDAQAAMKVWGQTVAQERRVAISPQPRIIDTVETLRREWGAGRLDAVALPLDEFGQIGADGHIAHSFFASVGGQVSDAYIVVTHREGPRVRLADLAGCEVNVFRGPRMALGEPWLELELVRLGLSPSSRHFGGIQRPTKLSKAVLPVFFRQAEAAIVDRRGFETMVELNPQLGRQLRVIASSPPLVSMILVLRTGFDPTVAPEVIASLRDFHRTQAGRQVLTLFQSDQLVDCDPELLRASIALLAEYRRLTVRIEAGGGDAP
ncbi:MAG: PhnD/SsuA/transferrin family substrate-binding protein [Verrucomicrobia bacterium]|nr:PhnD/SsuA/transferrin family substrate-binding protein [Verrucomicrobiota bacterium]